MTVIKVTPYRGAELVIADKPRGPKGDKGDTGNAATVAVGTVTTGAPGSSAAVVNSGTSSAAVLDVTIPEGQAGATGAPGGGAQTGRMVTTADFAQAPSSANADVPGMTLTYTAPATPVWIGFRVAGMVQHAGGSSASRVAILRVFEGATNVGVIVSMPAGTWPTTGGNRPFSGELRILPTAGPHTYKLQAYANGDAAATITWLKGYPTTDFNLPDFAFWIDEH